MERACMERACRERGCMEKDELCRAFSKKVQPGFLGGLPDAPV
jgi:hypothetical protein